ncbi:MAG: hypothetical protein WKF82_11765 [Nocardioidaceae bacterium]
MDDDRGRGQGFDTLGELASLEGNPLVRPVLRPGLQILRRDLTTLQLGLDWPGLAIVQETPQLRAVLQAIDGFRDAPGVVLAAASSTGLERSDCDVALGALIDCGAVVDQADCRSPRVGEHMWSALSLLAGPERAAVDVARCRDSAAIWVDGDGQVADRVRQLVEVAQLRGAERSSAADLVVVASDQEPPRTAIDRLMHAGVPHLWVCIRDVVGVVGPFVIPGQTSCLRCVDCARTDLDAAWPTLLASAQARPLLVPPVDPALGALVAAWAVLEAQVWASGIHPPTCDRVIEVPYGCGVVQTERFDLHPQCGCGWPTWQDTIGA